MASPTQQTAAAFEPTRLLVRGGEPDASPCPHFRIDRRIAKASRFGKKSGSRFSPVTASGQRNFFLKSWQNGLKKGVLD
jgi:hypothetical protein